MTLSEFEKISKDFENSLNAKYRRITGSYYTSFTLASSMINELFDNLSEDFIKNIEYKYFLEPCVGTGSFVFAYLNKILKFKFDKIKNKKIIDNIYVCDQNNDAIELYKKLFTKYIKSCFDIDIDENYFDTRIGKSLIFNIDSNKPEYLSINKYFGIKFDIIITNPPYKNLKLSKNDFDSYDLLTKEKEKYLKLTKIANENFKFSNSGIINTYKLFIEEILNNYSSNNAIVSLLIPSTILTDQTCTKLRDFIINSNKIISINTFKENNIYLDANQSICTMLIQKNDKTDEVLIRENENTEQIRFPLLKFINERNSNEIFVLDKQQYETYLKLLSFPKIKDLSFIVNMRGELDLTLNKEYIINKKTELKLLRGRNLAQPDISTEYVDQNFLNKTNKSFYIMNDRIACPQISNMHKEKRLIFYYVNSNFVLANSCNFISVLKNDYKVDINYLLALLNSNIINWFFKLTNSNNHISNTEIGNLPIPVGNAKIIKRISDIIETQRLTNNMTNKEEIEKLIYSLYGLDKPKSATIKRNISNDIIIQLFNDLINILPNLTYENSEKLLLNQISLSDYLSLFNRHLNKLDHNIVSGIITKYQKINQKKLINHITFKLSDLDLEMISDIPQGGNWKAIPDSVKEKSQRLLKIAKTGGRTTLYGRMDYLNPAYTITTYFNRPGNGTYVHPIHNRVISVREAARIQSFQDSYYFSGNKTSLLKQVGNAVPPILAKCIGEQIVKSTNCKTALDLFCGAGGMSSGLMQSGINVTLGTDFDFDSCTTYKINHPKSEIIHGDITNEEIKKTIITKAKKTNVDIICGGPPCQGFSYAGKRFIDDPRNILFRDYIDVVKAINPKIVIMENVEGMLTFNNGKVYKEIIETYKSLNYIVDGKILLATKYGVPQKRKRLIIIAVRPELNITPSVLFPTETFDKNTEVSVYQAINDLEEIDCSDDANYPLNISNEYLEKLKISYT